MRNAQINGCNKLKYGCAKILNLLLLFEFNIKAYLKISAYHDYIGSNYDYQKN